MRIETNRQTNGQIDRQTNMPAKKNNPLIWISVLVALLLGLLTAGYLAAPEIICFAETSIYVSPEKQPWEHGVQLGSGPVVLGNRLYLYSFIQGQQFQLWRGDPNGPDDPNHAWKKVSLGAINDPNATALGLHKGYLYLATNKENVPHVWRGEDPNQGEWLQVTPSGIGSGAITALSSFDGQLYLGLTGQQNSGGSAGSVQLWRSNEAASSHEITPSKWELVENGTYSALISSGFQEFEGKLYLGAENAQNKAAVWRLESSFQNHYLYSEIAAIAGNRSIAAMSVSDRILYAITLNEQSGAQMWSLASEGKNFSRVSSWEDKFLDPNRSTPLSMESLGSYLFLGFNYTGTKREVFRSYYDPNRLGLVQGPEQKEKQWELLSIFDKSKDQQPIKDQQMDKSDRLRWLYADQNNGFLYLGTEDPNQKVTLWRSTKLPIITIASPRSEIPSLIDKTYSYVYPLGAFNSEAQVKVAWKTTRTGVYTIRLIQFKDPNNSMGSPPAFSVSKQNAGNTLKEYGTSLPAQKQGTYISEIAWDANQSSSSGAWDQERYPVLFSFIYDTDPPETIPVVTSVSPGNKKLEVKWSDAHDKLSGVVKYKVWWEKVSPETDANVIVFTKSYVQPGEKDNKYTISGLINGQKYAVAVSAIDAAENGPDQPDRATKSFGTPELGRGLTDLVGEDGGCFLEAVLKGRIIFRTKK